MATVCNSIIPQLIVTQPSSCSQFTEAQSYSVACGAGTASDNCNITISGGQAPYTTTFTYPIAPTATNCTLNMAAFTGGSGDSPQFGYSFTSNNMCSLSIIGQMRVNYTVTDASGQTVTGSMLFNVSIVRSVVSGGGGGGGVSCVTIDSVLEDYNTASEVEVDNIMRVYDGPNSDPREVIVSYSETKMVPCVLLTCSNGAELECSTTAEISDAYGNKCSPESLVGELIPTKVDLSLIHI